MFESSSIKHFLIFNFFFAFLISHICVPLLLPSDLPNMEKPPSHRSSQARWKPPDTLHYFVLVPIKADTICCQECSDALQSSNPPLLHLLPAGVKCFWMYIMLLHRDLYCQFAAQRSDLQTSSLWEKKVLGVSKCTLMTGYDFYDF